MSIRPFANGSKPKGSVLLTGSLWQRSPIRDSEPSFKNAVLAFSDVAGGSDAGAAEANAAWLVDESRSASALKSQIARNIGAKMLFLFHCAGATASDEAEALTMVSSAHPRRPGEVESMDANARVDAQDAQR